LPVDDRPTIARALSKEPDQRFPTCRDMVEALRAGGTLKRRDVEEAESRRGEEARPSDATEEEEAQTLREGTGPRAPPLTPPGPQTVDESKSRSAEEARRTPCPASRLLEVATPKALDSTPTQSIRGPSAQGDARRPESSSAPAPAMAAEVVSEEPE